MNINDFAIGLGSVLLACGVCSPAMGSVNAHGSSLVFFGLALIVSALVSDYGKDRRGI